MKKKRICALITFIFILTLISPALAATKSVFPSGTGIVTVANNFTGNKDTITFDGRYFSPGDILKVYSDSSKTNEIGSPQTVNEYQDDVIISVDQLGQTSGSVYVTLQTAQTDESNVLKVNYNSEVIVINNVDKADTVTFKGLKAKDIAKVYASDGSTLLGQATAASAGDVTITLAKQLSESDLLIKVTVTSNGNESAKIGVNYSANVKTDAPIGAIEVNGNAADIVVSNNANIADTITFLGLKAKDIAKVYAADKATVLGQATAVKDGDVIVTLANQLSESIKEIYVTVKSDGELESDQTLVQYFRESKSTTLLAANITVTNNAVGTPDRVVVSSLAAGDIVKVYSAATGGTAIGTGTASAAGALTISIEQIGATAGNVYVSVTSTGKLESDRTAAAYAAESKSTKPLAANITVTNNAVGTSDKVVVSNLAAGDIVKVYSAATGGTAIGTGTATAAGALTISIEQIGAVAGNVYVSVTSTGKLESDRTTAAYAAESKSTSLSAANITVTNNAVGTADRVVVSGLVVGDIIKVYSAATGGTAIGTGTATAAGALTISIEQIGAVAGNVYVSLTSTGKLESDRTTAAYAAESKSTKPLATNITVTNNLTGTADRVVVSGLAVEDVVKVYAAATGGTAIGTATATAAGALTISIEQLGTAAGNVYVSVTSTGKLESDRTAAAYSAEPKSTKPLATNITVTNNITGKADTVVLSGLAVGDIVKVYSAATGGTAIGTGTATAAGALTISIEQLGTVAGNVYVSITSTGKLESDRTTAAYAVEPKSNITVTNNAVGTADTVVVSELAVGDIVKVYAVATGGTVIGTATEKAGTVTISISQLGAAAGTVYVSITSIGKPESDRTVAAYAAEEKSTTPLAANITVTNNAVGTSDTVVVSNLALGDIVKVYSVATGGTAIGTATAKSAVTVSIAQLGASAGTVYVSVTSTGKFESDRTAVAYAAEVTSTKPLAANITVTNNAVGTPDTVVVSNLAVGDIAKVYLVATGGTAIGTATATAKSAGIVTVKITQLGATAGTVYVSVTSTGKLESDRTLAAYVAESKSIKPLAANITVTNNAVGTADIVEVSNLALGDIVKVYSVATDGTAIGTVKVTAAGAVTVKITQLGATAGNVYVSVTSTGKLESDRTTIAYAAEATSTKPLAANITVTNNAVGTADTVVVSNLAAGDVVKVYSVATGGKAIGTAKATAAGSVTVSIAQLGAASGNVYVSVTSTGKLESDRTTVAYAAELKSTAPSGIVVTNNLTGKPDTVVVSSLAIGDIVKVYSVATGGTAIGTVKATAAGAVTVSIKQLGTAAGTVYVSVTSTAKLESDRTAAAYAAELKSTSLAATNISITNNAVGTADTVVISGLEIGDVVKVYSVATGGKAIGTGKAIAEGALTISIAQLGATEGTVYVSVTSTEKLESDVTAAAYSSESKSTAPSGIVVTNNVTGKPDTVVVSGLAAGDIVKVYSTETDGKAIGTGKAKAEGELTISIAQLGTAAGTVYVSVTSTAKLESDRTATAYSSESKSTVPVGIVVTNNVTGTPDTVVVSGLAAGDVVKVYSAETGGKAIGTVKAKAAGSVTVSIKQLGAAAGTVYVSVTSTEKLESDRTAATYSAELKSTAPAAIVVTNNVTGTADTVVVSGLAVGDVVKVYSVAIGGKAIGTVKAIAAGSVTVSIKQLGTAAGTVYVSVTSTAKLESDRTAATYTAEVKSTNLLKANITVTNNVTGTPDTVVVSGLAVGDVVNVYSTETGGKAIGTVKAKAAGSVTVSIAQLGTAAGTVYVSVTRTGKLESDRTAVTYSAESKSTGTLTTNIIVANYADIQDVITVKNLSAGDIIKVYSSATGGKAIATSKAVATGKTVISFNVAQLGTTSGTVYVSITNTGKLESDRIEVTFVSEP